jgi:hypothetical protein
MLNYITDHWNGKLPLWKAYWINNFLALFVTVAVAFFLGMTFALILPPLPPKVYSIMGVILVGLPISIWVLVGIWRSASLWTTNNPRKFWVWGRLAQVSVILGVFRTIVEVVAVFAI